METVDLQSLDLPQFRGVEMVKRSHLEGMQVVVRFPNNYGASIVNHRGSYGLELAVAHWQGEVPLDWPWHICYRTPITDDVLGWLNADTLRQALENIYMLKPDEECGG